MLSKRILQLKPSATLSLDAKVKQLQEAGMSIINLTVGEPDFETPAPIKKAGIKAIKEGFTHYTPAAGIKELRQAIAEKFLKENKIFYQPSEIIIGIGAKQMLYSVFQVLCQKGDEVLIPIPTWSTYVEQVKLAGAKPVFIPLKPPFKLTAGDLEKHILEKTKVILINTPSNPTGAIIEKTELEKIANLAVKKNIFIISDEVYEKMVYGKKHYSIAAFDENIKRLTITINSFSKTYAMTGWRIGYAAGPKKVIDAMAVLSSQVTSGTSSISQKAAVAAIGLHQTYIKNMIKEFKKRRDFIYSAFSKIKGISLTEPEGAFYAFLDIKELLSKTYLSSNDWVEVLFEKTKVAAVPGEAFYAPGYVRLSYAVSFKEIKEAVKRIKEFVK